MKKRRGERKKEKTTDALERVGGFVCGAFSFIYFFFFFFREIGRRWFDGWKFGKGIGFGE